LIFIDSNIWCYYFDARLPEHQLVRGSIRKALLSNQEIACNTVVVMEIAHYLVRHFEEEDARRKIEHFINLRNLKILDFNTKLMTESLERLLSYGYSHGLGGRDSTILATINTLKIKSLITHDGVFKRLGNKIDCEVIDPINIKEN
jgi:predicted nucleic acid-binding protein